MCVRPLALSALLAVTLSTSSCLVWRNHWRNSPTRATAKDVAYVDGAVSSDGNDKHRLDIYAPVGADGVPVVVFVHGGFWQRGDRNFYAGITGLYGNIGTALGDNDVVTVVPSYRLAPEASIDDMLDDIAAAVRFARDHIAVHGGDPHRIVLVGHSAGAHLATLLTSKPGALAARGLDDGTIKGVVALSGIYDVAAAAAHPTEPDREVPWNAIFGATDTEKAALSPRTHLRTALTHNAPPMLFVVGENDYDNCKRDAAAVAADLNDLAGTRAFFRTLPGLTHERMVLDVGTAEDTVGPLVAAFATVMTTTTGATPTP